jgi:hypothetical protein
VHYGVEEITVNVRKMIKKIVLDLFADLAVFESGTKQVNNFEIHSPAQKTTHYDFFNK